MNNEQMIGEIVERVKSIEYYFDCILHNFLLPQKNVEFFRNVILHTSIIPISSKLKIIKSICKNYNIKQDFDMEKIHKLLNIRNIFAHQSVYVEHPENISKIDKFDVNGKYIQTTPEELYLEFDKIYHAEINNIIKFSESISKR